MTSDIDWRKCVICQEIQRGESLICCKKKNGWTDAQKMNQFDNLYENLQKLLKAGIQPENVKMPTQITGKTMFENNALWHKSCRLRLNDSKEEKKLEAHKKQNEQIAPPTEEAPAP